MQDRFTIVLSIIKALCLAFFLYFSGSGFFGRIPQLIEFYPGLLNGILVNTVHIGITAFCMAALFITAFHKRLLFRLLLGIPLVSGTMAGKAFESITEEPTAFFYLANLWQNRDFAAEAFSFYLKGNWSLLFLGMAGLVGFILPPRDIGLPGKAVRLMTGKASLAAALSPYLLLLVVHLLFHGKGLMGLPMGYKTIVAWGTVFLNEAVEPETIRRPANLPLASSTTSLGDIVIIMDESVRADYLDINISRGTTPYLKTLRSSLVNFGIAVSASNCSQATNMALRFLLRPDSAAADYYQNSSLWQYARKAGFRTIYIDAQSKKDVPTNDFSMEERSFIDEFLFAPQEASLERDLFAARKIRQFSSDTVPQFIYVLKSGIHFPFTDRFDTAAAIFRPFRALPQMPLTLRRTALQNAYKNAVRSTLEPFFQALFSPRGPERCIIVYTGDHGQNLLEDGAEGTHCRYKKATPEEAAVPLIVYTDNDSLRSLFKMASVLNRNRLSHYHITPTLLMLMGYDSALVAARQGECMLARAPAGRRFIAGGIDTFHLGIVKTYQLLWKPFPPDWHKTIAGN